jgi:hypothetical protein
VSACPTLQWASTLLVNRWILYFRSEVSLALCPHKCSGVCRRCRNGRTTIVCAVQSLAAIHGYCANTVSCAMYCVTSLHRQGSPERDRGTKGPDKLFKKIKANKLGAAEPRTVRWLRTLLFCGAAVYAVFCNATCALLFCVSVLLCALCGRLSSFSLLVTLLRPLPGCLQRCSLQCSTYTVLFKHALTVPCFLSVSNSC